MSYHIIYCRKSSESEERQVLSIESQVKELKSVAKRLKAHVLEIITESRSAKQPGRPAFNSMMRKLQSGQIKGIITWKLDRLARNPIDGSGLVWALDQGKIAEIVTPQQFFQNNSNDKFLMQLEFGMAKKYVDDLSDNVKRGNRAKLERGWLPGSPPLGYLNDPDDRTIIIDPNLFPLVRKMWEMLLSGVAPSRILSIANTQWGFRSRRFKKSGPKPLSLSGIYKMFGNTFYYGLLERKEGVFIGKHQPMITEDEYWQAQEILGRKGRQRPKKHLFPFTGLMRCGECGCMITAEERTKKSGRHYVYYRCTKKKGQCNQRYLNAAKLEDQIMASLSRINVSSFWLDQALKHLAEENKEDSKNNLIIRQSLEHAVSLNQKKLANLNDMRINELIDDEEYRTEKRKLLKEKISLTKKQKSKDYGQKTSSEIAAEKFTFAYQVIDRFQNGSPEDKQGILREIGSNFSVKDKKLLIDVEKPFLIIGNGLQAVKNENIRLEPSKNGSAESQNELSQTAISLWWACVDDVRTFYEKTTSDLTS